MIHQNTNTGLVVPNSDAKMVIANGQIIDCPPDYVVHPQTGCVLPIQGNVAYDPITSRLVVTVDSAFGKLFKEAIL